MAFDFSYFTDEEYLLHFFSLRRYSVNEFKHIVSCNNRQDKVCIF